MVGSAIRVEVEAVPVKPRRARLEVGAVLVKVEAVSVEVGAVLAEVREELMEVPDVVEAFNGSDVLDVLEVSVVFAVSPASRGV